MKRMKLLFAATFATLSLVFFSCDPEHYDNAVWHMWKITIMGEEVEYGEATIPLGDTLHLGLKIVPTFANVIDPVWISQDESIATVTDSGVVTAMRTGSTVITVYSEYNPEIFDNLYLKVEGGAINFNKDKQVKQSEAESRRK